jgi:GNAT superfamily N-acetyltransferase
MSVVEVRPYQRGDREHVARLVNAHAAAVLPGVTASVNTVLSQFEREPGEFIVGPWASERQVLVAEQDGSLAAAALIVRYRPDLDVGPAYRNAGEIRWLLFWPLAPAGNPYWRDGQGAADALMAECLDRLGRWQVSRVYADGALPLPGIYGVPEQWPHIERLLGDSGFVAPSSAIEIVHLADLADLPEPGGAPVHGLQLRRTVGINGTRLSAQLDSTTVGYIEVEVLDPAERHTRTGGLADIGNLHVSEQHRRQGVATWLLLQAAHWLRLGHVERLLHYAAPDETAEITFIERNHFTEVTRTRRGWEHQAQAGPEPRRTRPST